MRTGFLGYGLGRWLCAALAVLVVGCLSACGGDEPLAEKSQTPAPPVGLVAYWETDALVVESLDGSSKRRFPVDVDEDTRYQPPSIAPSGERIAFLDAGVLFVLELASGSVQRVPLALEPQEEIDGAVGWSADEQKLILTGGRLHSCEAARSTDTRVYTVSRDGAQFRRIDNVIPATAAPVRGNPTWTANPTWSPDGRWLHYEVWQGSECETRGVYFRKTQMTVMPATKGKPVALAQIYHVPRASWAPDSTRIAYATEFGESGELKTVDVQTQETTVLGDFVGDVFWTRRGIYAYEGGLQRLMLVPADGSQPMTVAAHQFGHLVAAPVSGDWVAVCNSYCEVLVIYTHDGKRLLRRPLGAGDYEPVVAATSD